MDAPSGGVRGDPARFARGVAEGIQVGINADLNVRRNCPPRPLRERPGQLLRQSERDSILVGMGGHQRHHLSAEPLPSQTAPGQAHRGSRIIVSKNLAIGAAGETHLFRARLAQAHTVTGAGAFKDETPVRRTDFITIAAQRVPSEITAHRETE